MKTCLLFQWVVNVMLSPVHIGRVLDCMYSVQSHSQHLVATLSCLPHYHHLVILSSISLSLSCVPLSIFFLTQHLFNTFHFP